MTAASATIDARAAYRILARTYDQQPNALVSLEQRTVEEILPCAAGQTIVDAGAGTGRWARHCAKLGARSISIDYCREMLDRAPRPAVLADFTQLPLPDACADLTICAFAIGYAPNCFAELIRITRPGGFVLVSDLHPGAVRRGWTRTFRLADQLLNVAHEPYDLDQLCDPRLDLIELREPCFGPPEQEIFERCGHGSRFVAASQWPAIFAALWIRK